MIYLDNAATSLQRPEEVVQAVSEAMCRMGNPGRGAHEASLHAARTVYQARKAIGRLFGVRKPERVVFYSKRDRGSESGDQQSVSAWRPCDNDLYGT